MVHDGAARAHRFCDLKREQVDDAPTQDDTQFTLLPLFQSLTIPCTLAELGLGQVTLADLEQVCAFACAPDSDLHHLPFAVAPADLLAALVSTTSGERQPA